jgi:hypothetical protein
MYIRTIVCLANSRKPPSGRCIAGKELNNGQIGAWLRPVSDRQGHEVSEIERRYENGRRAQLLDVIQVPLIQPAPQGHQIENHVLDKRYCWVKQGVATWEQVVAAVDLADNAFWGNSRSTFHGTNDKVSEADVARIGGSLRLVRVNDLAMRVRTEEGFENNPSRRRVRGSFTVLGNHFLLSVTDPEMEERYLAQPDGEYAIGDAVVCVSMVEVWNGFAFRVIASIITPQRCLQAAARQ